MYMMDIRFAQILLRKGTPERTLTGTSSGLIGRAGRDFEPAQKRFPGPVGSPGCLKTGDMPRCEGRGGERGLEVVASGIAVDIERLADAVEVLHGL
jgi:hypothetical protein